MRGLARGIVATGVHCHAATGASDGAARLMGLRIVLTLAAVLLPVPASASVGVNIAPGWGDTVDGRDIPKMERVLADLRPDTLRMPWVDNVRTRETLRFAIEQHIDTLVIDNPTWTPEQVVAEIAQAAAEGFPVTAIEGVNEPDFPATGYTPTPVPITAEKLAEVRDRQERLYAAVAGRWPVLCPSAMYQLNEPSLNSLPCDIVSAHRYPDIYGAPPAADAAKLPATAKPIWVTETGVPTTKKWIWWPFWWTWQVTETPQRDYLTQFISMLRANGAERVMVYSLQDTGRDAFNPENNFGLYTWEGNPKLAVAPLRG
jgi:hypothetical protein